MTNIVGHADALKAIPAEIPPVLLLSGPEGVGKRTVGIMLALGLAKGADLHACGRLTVEGAREVHQHHSQTPLSSRYRVSLIDLTTASEKAVNSLLKILEEPPETSRFILHTDKEPLLTIRSRAFQVRFGLLSEEEVLTVLRQQSIKEPEEAARLSKGRVSVAMSHAYSKDARARVEGLLMALRDTRASDTKRMEAALTNALRLDLKGDGYGDTRDLVGQLFLNSLYASLYVGKTHVLSHVPSDVRIQALDIMRSGARPQFSVRAACWHMARSL